MSNAPLMPKATAVWLLDNTALSFDQVADFTKMHPLEIQAIADGEVAQGIVGVNPIANGQLTQEDLDRAQGDPRAAKIYETIGVYLGYAVPHYAEFYDFDHLLVLGRVTTGKGGDILVAKAREVLQTCFPNLRIQISVPDEKSKRHGQAVAAASLPAI